MGFISEPRKAKTRAMENAENIQRTKVDPPPHVTAHKRQRTFTDEEDVAESSGVIHWRLKRQSYSEDVSALSKSDELDSDEQVNDDGSDADHEESEGEEPETTAMMLSDETPTWRDLDNAVSESIDETTTTCGDSELYSSDSANPKLTSAACHSIASLIRTESGKVKLLDQNQETRRVVRDAIVDAKCHIVFVDAYPELIDKNQVSLQSLLTVAEKRGLHAIKQRLQADAKYAAQLGSLVEPRLPLLRRELKEVACANIDSYFRLGLSVVKAKRLMEKHAYIYALKFDLNDEPSPIGKKPYQGDLLIFLIYSGVFNGTKSIGVKYAERFVKIANNKANRPEIPVPLLALVATSVYAALFWKTLGSPGKFNFTGNQFSETYVFHVKFLEDLKKDAPGKFHHLMADIYGAVQVLKRKGNDRLATEHEDALALLDLDGMVED
ncbi:uncharacterized protein EDB93DRAFT_1102243 [Suillus bovinus]|uniref:uncharacterized protein n=1 Tax=Suillus bovinus TaxID=48563 RepID=UPI001B86F9AC|nr:uncharacterized protein EDB93DRAFT_1102243 [Suillus bovinus]KAG2154471.1 hypothetical protein EDB93DRAFT_1102243 [Suillus bovinus]